MHPLPTVLMVAIGGGRAGIQAIRAAGRVATVVTIAAIVNDPRLLFAQCTKALLGKLVTADRGVGAAAPLPVRRERRGRADARPRDLILEQQLAALHSPYRELSCEGP
jgi:hypothetical protein